MARTSWADYEDIYGESREDFEDKDNRSSYQRVLADAIGESL